MIQSRTNCSIHSFVIFSVMSGLILIVVGIPLWLIANGNLPKNPKFPEKMEKWRNKFGLSLKVISSIMVSYGILDFIGYF